MSASMAPWARTGISISPSRTSRGMPRTFFTRKPIRVPVVFENVLPTHMRSPYVIVKLAWHLTLTVVRYRTLPKP